MVDLYILSGGTPNDVASQVLDIVGKPTMPPMWSLGFHNCRYGYPSIAYVEEVVQNYTSAQIPLDTQV